MIVNGVEITEKQIEAGKARMMTGGAFTFFDIQCALRNAGVPDENSVAYRAADRLVQKQRKAGLVKFEKKVWTPCSV